MGESIPEAFRTHTRPTILHATLHPQGAIPTIPDDADDTDVALVTADDGDDPIGFIHVSVVRVELAPIHVQLDCLQKERSTGGALTYPYRELPPSGVQFGWCPHLPKKIAECSSDA